MDEQVDGDALPFQYVDTHDKASYEGFAHRHFLDPLEAAAHVTVPVVKPNLDAVDSFETDIDLLVLAIGPSGNYANVMPGTPLHVGWHIAELTNEFRSAHTAAASESYAGAKFRTHGMSLGPQQVLTASLVVVVARGSGDENETSDSRGGPLAASNIRCIDGLECDASRVFGFET
jgi:6-phosphogluconolactonase/glucosamine-6-phosphate isomerase/deaminase